VRSVERVLVLCEHSRAGDATIDLARDLAETSDAALTVVGLAPQAPSGPRCGNSAVEYNEALADSVARDLDRARERLGAAAGGTTFVLLVEGADQTLEQFAHSGSFGLVLLPARHRPLRRTPYHPQASRLKLIAGAEIRIVAPAASAQPQPRRHGDGAG
jgi:nucleotide-binding universal stress UspA family protein